MVATLEYQDTVRRTQDLEKKGILFVGSGVWKRIGFQVWFISDARRKPSSLASH